MPSVLALTPATLDVRIIRIQNPGTQMNPKYSNTVIEQVFANPRSIGASIVQRMFYAFESESSRSRASLMLPH